MNDPKVLIAAPIGGQKQYSINLWFEWIANQSYKNYDVAVCCNGEGYTELAKKISEVEITDVHKQDKKIIPLVLAASNELSVIQKITYAREKIRRYAVTNEYDYIFFLDTDTFPNRKDCIQQLINRKADCISGLYFYKGSRQPVIIDFDTHTNISLGVCQDLHEKNQICKVWGFGFGCLLLSKKTFTKAEFDYNLFGEERSDDFGYCHVLENNGVERWFDPAIICHHMEDPNISNIPLANKFIIPVVSPKSINSANALILEHGKHKNRSENKTQGMDSKK